MKSKSGSSNKTRKSLDKKEQRKVDSPQKNQSNTKNDETIELLLKPIYNNIIATIQIETITLTSIHELIYKSIIDLPNCEIKTKILDQLYSKVEMLYEQR